MKFLTPICFLVISVLFLSSGCEKNTEVVEKLKAENIKHRASNQKLSSRLENLEIDYENLQIKYNESEAWSKALSSQFGPSVWFFSEYDKPLPQESVREATPSILINKLNKLFVGAGDPEVSIESITDNAIHVSISNEDKLTQNMGSSGASGYISSVVYTLTSIDAIKCVYIDFKKAGHALPGEYCR